MSKLKVIKQSKENALLLVKALKKDKRIKIQHIGMFKIKRRKAAIHHLGLNGIKKIVKVPARNYIVFEPRKDIKHLINN